MKIIISLILGVGICFNSLAVTIDVGGVKIEIPKPESFSLVTPEMKELYEQQKLFVAPTNVSFAKFIPDDEVGIALMNEIPDQERRFTVQTGINMVSWSVNKAEFDELNQMMKKQNAETINKVKEKIKEPMNEFNSKVKDETGLDIDLAITEMIPLDIHFENEKAFSFSQFSKYSTNNEHGTPEIFVAVYTTTFVLVKSKVLFLYTYGTKDDLEWTRDASETWVKEIIKANPNNIKTTIKENTPSFISRIEWWKVGLATLVFSLYGWFKGRGKEKDDSNEDK